MSIIVQEPVFQLLSLPSEWAWPEWVWHVLERVWREGRCEVAAVSVGVAWQWIVGLSPDKGRGFRM